MLQRTVVMPETVYIPTPSRVLSVDWPFVGISPFSGKKKGKGEEINKKRYMSAKATSFY